MWGGISASRSGVTSLAAPGSVFAGRCLLLAWEPQKERPREGGTQFPRPQRPHASSEQHGGDPEEGLDPPPWVTSVCPACTQEEPGCFSCSLPRQRRILENRQLEPSPSSGVHSRRRAVPLITPSSGTQARLPWGPEYTGDPSPPPRQRPRSKGTDV